MNTSLEGPSPPPRPLPPALAQSFLLLATLNLWLHTGEIKILNKRMICFSENTKVCWDKVVHFLLKCSFWLPHAGQGCRKQGSGANVVVGVCALCDITKGQSPELCLSARFPLKKS